MALVSVVMVAHQDTPYVRPAVASIFNQSLQDFEFVFVNNGSGMQAGDLGEPGHDPRLRWLDLPSNLGIAAGLNAGIQAAAGEFIAVLDSDDIALPRRLERQVALMQSDAQLGLVNCGVSTIDQNGNVTGREFVLLDRHQQHVFSAYFSSTITSAFMVRREVARAFPQRSSLDSAPDYDFFSRVADSWQLGGVPEILLHYRRHPLQITIKARDAQIYCECLVRLMTARRRSGQSEQLESIERELADWRRTPSPAAEIYATFARRFLQEGFTSLAVYHARKLLSVKRTPRTVLWATGLLIDAIWCKPRSMFWLLRLFLVGPVRAHGLKPF